MLDVLLKQPEDINDPKVVIRISDRTGKRSQMNAIEYDETKKLFKYHPLFDWSFEDVENYISEHGILYNSLHDKGYLSVGFEPCRRAFFVGQDFRSGRWWWENEGPRERCCPV